MSDFKNWTFKEATRHQRELSNAIFAGIRGWPLDCNILGREVPIVSLNEDDPYERTWLSIIKKYQMKRIAEVGVFKGSLAFYVIDNYDELEKYYLIDPWKVYSDWCDDMALDKHEELRENKYAEHRFDQKWYERMFNSVNNRAKKHDEVEVIRNESIYAAKEIEDNSLDGVYIDGVHDFPNAINDIFSWLPKVKEDGVVSGHDYSPRFGGLIRAVDFVFGNDFKNPLDFRRKRFSCCWYVELNGNKGKYLARIKNKFPDIVELLKPENKYMHLEENFMKDLYG